MRSPLDGDWASHPSRKQINENLVNADQEWATGILAAERITDDLTAVYTFDGDVFPVA